MSSEFVLQTKHGGKDSKSGVITHLSIEKFEVSTTFEEKNYCFYCVPFKWTICCRKYELMITKIWTDRFIDPCPSPFMKNEMLLALRK